MRGPPNRRKGRTRRETEKGGGHTYNRGSFPIDVPLRSEVYRIRETCAPIFNSCILHQKRRRHRDRRGKKGGDTHTTRGASP